MNQPPDRTPIGERRRQLKNQIWKAEKAVTSKNEEIERFKDLLHDTVDFDAVGATSDAKRKQHFKTVLHQSPELTEKLAELSKLEDSLQALKATLSGINFDQRERQIDAVTAMASQLERFAVSLDKLDASMFTFLEGAQRVEDAVARLTNRNIPATRVPPEKATGSPKAPTAPQVA